MPDVREAVDADAPALAGMLARAFHDDPVTEWFYRREASRPRWIERFMQWQLGRLIPQGQVHTTADGAGAALWALPDRWRETGYDTMRLLLAVGPAMLARLPQALRAVSGIEQRHPRERHMYLAVLGTDPSRQGEGIGSALMAPALTLCDAEGLPAYLESSKERNVAFYGRFGFRVLEEIPLARGGPPVWLMWRDPR